MNKPSDRQDLLKTAQALIASSESCDIDRGTGSWAPDDAWSALVDGIEHFIETEINANKEASEIERLRRALRYEENRFSRIGTHGPECWKWGPGHYECALRKIKEHTKCKKSSLENETSPN